MLSSCFSSNVRVGLNGSPKKKKKSKTKKRLCHYLKSGFVFFSNTIFNAGFKKRQKTKMWQEDQFDIVHDFGLEIFNSF